MRTEDPTRKEGLPSRSLEVAQILLEKRAVILRPEKPFTFASGIESPIYTDVRLLISHPQECEKIVSFFCERIVWELGEDYKDCFVSATAAGGIPWGAWVAEVLGLPMVYVGKNERGEMETAGWVKADKKAIIIEDLVTTGGSAIQNAENLRKKGVNAGNCFAVFTYEFGKSRSQLGQAGLVLYPLCGFTVLAEYAFNSRRINESEFEMLSRWWKSQENMG